MDRPSSKPDEETKFIWKLVESDDKIILVAKVHKYNYKCVCQDRFFVLTHKNVYNIATPNILQSALSFLNITSFVRRKIPLTKITAITISKSSSEFVIHVPEEYDYRYASQMYLILLPLPKALSRREEIVTRLYSELLRQDSDKRIHFFFKVHYC